MSCQACDIAQELDDRPDSISTLKLQTFLRVGNGNVMISGCRKHLEEMTGKALVYLKPHPDVEGFDENE
jgi:hypothetical protein